MHLSMVRNSGKKIRAIEPTHTYHVVKVYYIQTAKKKFTVRFDSEIKKQKRTNHRMNSTKFRPGLVLLPG
jgi:hypothetical protein